MVVMVVVRRRRHVAMAADHPMVTDHAMVAHDVMARRHDVMVVMVVADRLG